MRPSSNWLGSRSFKAEMGNRTPLAVQIWLKLDGRGTSRNISSTNTSRLEQSTNSRDFSQIFYMATLRAIPMSGQSGEGVTKDAWEVLM